MKIDVRAVGAAVVCGVALILVGLIVGGPTVGIEGAYFDQGTGTPPASSFVQTGTSPLDPSDGNLWIGAGIAVLLVTVVVLVLSTRGRGRTPRS